MRLRLIPVSNRGNIVGERPVPTAIAPSKRLNRNSKGAVKPDRIGNVPAVEPETLLRLVQPIGANYLG